MSDKKIFSQVLESLISAEIIFFFAFMSYSFFKEKKMLHNFALHTVSKNEWSDNT